MVIKLKAAAVGLSAGKRTRQERVDAVVAKASKRLGLSTQPEPDSVTSSERQSSSSSAESSSSSSSSSASTSSSSSASTSSSSSASTSSSSPSPESPPSHASTPEPEESAPGPKPFVWDDDDDFIHDLLDGDYSTPQAPVPERTPQLVDYSDTSGDEEPSSQDQPNMPDEEDIPNQIPGFNSADYYRLENRDPIRFKGGQVTQQQFRLFITQDPNTLHPGHADYQTERIERLQAIMDHAFYTGFRDSPRDAIAIGQIFIENPNIYNKVKPTRRCLVKDLDFKEVAGQLAAMEQSPTDGPEGEKPEVRLEDTFFTLVTYVPPSTPEQIGGRQATGMKARNEPSFYHYMRSSSSFIDPMVKSNRLPAAAQNLCIPLCLVMGLKRIQLEMKPREEADPGRGAKTVNFKNYCCSRQMLTDARELVRRAGVQPEEGPFSMQQIGEFQRNALGDDYQIKVFSADKPPDHSFGSPRARHHINLLIREDIVPDPAEGKSHAVLISNMRGFMGKRRMFCEIWDRTHKTYYRESAHRCSQASCIHCHVDKCANQDNNKHVRPYTTCTSCNRKYMTEACFKAHKDTKLCDKWRRCHLCRQVIPRLKKKDGQPDHKCGYLHCKHCGKEHLTTEWCYVRPVPGKESKHHPDNVKFKPTPAVEVVDAADAPETSPLLQAHEDPDREEEVSFYSESDPEQPGTSTGRSRRRRMRRKRHKNSQSAQEESAAPQGQEPRRRNRIISDSEPEEEQQEPSPPPEPAPELPPKSIEELLAKKKLWYADAETVVDEATGEHTANLLILQKPRHDKGPTEYDQRVYRGMTAMRQFTEDCMRQGSEYANHTIVFHNASGFDAHLWQRELMLLGSPPKDPIYKGERILTFRLQQNNIQVLDSLQFLPNTPLSKLPEMFSLESGAKGEFPHRLNTPEWVDYSEPDKVYQEQDEEGTLHRFPLKKYFHAETKRPKELAKFERWHAEQVQRFRDDPSLEYKPARELEAYCEQDVKILRLGCEVMRGSWLKQFPDMELFDYLTFPSFNNALFRTKYMPKDSIVLLPPEGFHFKNRKHSMEALAWISMVRAELTAAGTPLVEVRHARRGYEVSIAGHHVDGYARDSNGGLHIFEFHGCRFHGCVNCRHKHAMSEEQQELRAMQREDTLEQSAFFKELSVNPASPYGPFTYHEIWECEWKELTGQGTERVENWDEEAEEEDEDKRWRREYTDAFLAEYLSTADRLKPVDAFHGGRTNVIQHQIRNLQAGYRLGYYDFTSLYPSVNFSMHEQEWPVGPPDHYLGSEVRVFNAPPLEQAFGLWKVDVLPPKHLRHPVIGENIKDKLVFHLCSLCARTSRQGYCPHADGTRTMKKLTIFTGELQLAVEKGYKVTRVYEVWDWPPERRTKDIFKDLIRDQYAKKVYASGAPEDPAELERIIYEHWESMMLELLPEEFRKDPAMRALAKFSLNNIWGYLGKREDVASTLYTDNIEELNKLENSDKRDVTSIFIPFAHPDGTGDLLMVQHKPKENTAGRNGSIMLALMTTAYARMQLYKVIDQYEDEVVYFDTDSIILLLPPGKEPPPTSSRLGDLKDEVVDGYGPHARMTSFVSLGPKVYSYKVENEKGELLAAPMKLKGISATAPVCNIVNDALMHTMVEEREESEGVVVPQFQIRRKMVKGSLFSHNFYKRLQFSSCKRWILSDPDNVTYDTLPFGYVSDKKNLSPVDGNAGHTAYNHTVSIAARTSHPSLYKRSVTLKDGRVFVVTENQTGPNKALVWERARVLVVQVKMTVCFCGRDWSDHGLMKMEPDCWVDRLPLHGTVNVNKIVNRPLHIFYDDDNVCFVDHRLNCLYAHRSDIGWTVEEDVHFRRQLEVEKKAKEEMEHKEKQAMVPPPPPPPPPPAPPSMPKEPMWSGDINAPFSTADETLFSPILPIDLAPEYNPHWDPNDWSTL